MSILDRPRSADVSLLRRHFPILQQRVHGKPLVYLDNAATTQKPQVVVDRMGRYYAEENANIHAVMTCFGSALVVGMVVYVGLAQSALYGALVLFLFS